MQVELTPFLFGFRERVLVISLGSKCAPHPRKLGPFSSFFPAQFRKGSFLGPLGPPLVGWFFPLSRGISFEGRSEKLPDSYGIAVGPFHEVVSPAWGKNAPSVGLSLFRHDRSSHGEILLSPLGGKVFFRKSWPKIGFLLKVRVLRRAARFLFLRGECLGVAVNFPPSPSNTFLDGNFVDLFLFPKGLDNYPTPLPSGHGCRFLPLTTPFVLWSKDSSRNSLGACWFLQRRPPVLKVTPKIYTSFPRCDVPFS